MRLIKFLLSGLLLSITLGVRADFYSLEPPEVSDLAPQSTPVNSLNWRQDVADANAPGGVAALPIPRITKHQVMTLSLKEAILLSLRNNPNIQSTELNRITDKFALILAHNGFEPTYAVGGTARFLKGNKPVYSSTAGVNWNTTMGTSLGMSYNNTYIAGGGPGQTNLTVTQHLLKGFGRELNLIPWKNALDTENQARLTFKSSIISQVVTVITAYRQLIQDYQSLEIQKRTLASNLQTVNQSKLKVKVGQLAQSDLMQQQATYETTKLSMLQQQSSFISDYQSFLQALGFKADAKVEIVKTIEFPKLKVPPLKRCIDLAIKGNIDYQTALIAIRATQRAIITAKDANRWTLDLAGSMTIFSQGSNTPNYQVVNGVTQVVQTANNLGSPNLTLTLNIPINNISAQQAIVSAQIKLQQAKLALEATKLQLIRTITNEWYQIQNQIRTVKSSQQQVMFQQSSLQAAQIKYKYGRTTTFEVNQIQNQLLQQETTLVSNKISLLNLITTLNKDLGITLDQWGIGLRY